jgi:2-iminobutanoate/2-iminopropanoate deaminase
MKKIVHTDHAPKAVGPYSQAVESGGVLYVSGQIPIDPATGNLVEGCVACQTEQVLKNVGAILSAAGYSFADVVKTTVLLADIADFAVVNEVYARYYTSQQPARSTFAVAGLPKGARVEIETIAVK